MRGKKCKRRGEKLTEKFLRFLSFIAWVVGKKCSIELNMK